MVSRRLKPLLITAVAVLALVVSVGVPVMPRTSRSIAVAADRAAGHGDAAGRGAAAAVAPVKSSTAAVDGDRADAGVPPTYPRLQPVVALTVAPLLMVRLPRMIPAGRRAERERAPVDGRAAGVGVVAVEGQGVGALHAQALAAADRAGDRRVSARRVDAERRAGLEAAGIEVRDVRAGPSGAAGGEEQRAARVDRDVCQVVL